MQQIYKFLKKKDKGTFKTKLKLIQKAFKIKLNISKDKYDSSKDDLVLSSLLLSSNHDIHDELQDSLAAKAAHNLLSKWHSRVPFASFQELKEMYNKFYEEYYEKFNDYHHDEAHHHVDDLYPDHYHNHHHHHLNLLDFIKSKNDDSKEANKDQFLDSILSKSSNSVITHFSVVKI